MISFPPDIGMTDTRLLTDSSFCLVYDYSSSFSNKCTYSSTATTPNVSTDLNIFQQAL